MRSKYTNGERGREMSRAHVCGLVEHVMQSNPQCGCKEQAISAIYIVKFIGIVVIFNRSSSSFITQQKKFVHLFLIRCLFPLFFIAVEICGVGNRKHFHRDVWEREREAEMIGTTYTTYRVHRTSDSGVDVPFNICSFDSRVFCWNSINNEPILSTHETNDEHRAWLCTFKPREHTNKITSKRNMNTEHWRRDKPTTNKNENWNEEHT